MPKKETSYKSVTRVHSPDSDESLPLLSSSVFHERQNQDAGLLEIIKDGNTHRRERVSVRDLHLYLTGIVDDFDPEPIFESPMQPKEKPPKSNSRAVNQLGVPIARTGSSAHIVSEPIDISKTNTSQFDGKTTAMASSHSKKLSYRDLRRVESAKNGVPMLLVRRHAVVIVVKPFRAIIFADRLILMYFSKDESSAAENLVAKIQSFLTKAVHRTTPTSEILKLQHGYNGNFEEYVYEELLKTALKNYEQECSECGHFIDTIMNDIQDASILSVEMQEALRATKHRIGFLVTELNSVTRTLEELLDDDEDLALLNLSFLKKQPSSYKLPLTVDILALHDKMEILMEAHAMDCTSMLGQLTGLRSHIQTVEESLLLRLDTSRNMLMVGDTIISVVGFSIAVGGFVGSIFGMNIPNGFEDSEEMFFKVSAATILFMILLSVSILAVFRYYKILPKTAVLSKEKIRAYATMMTQMTSDVNNTGSLPDPPSSASKF